MAQAHVAPYKKDVVKELAELLTKYPIIGIVNMENLPAAQLAKLRSSLREKVTLYMTKRRLMLHSIEAAKGKVPKLETIVPHLKGMPALLFTKENPFSLYKTLKKSKSPAPAKPGQLAPRDIIIPAGPTPFAPGPVISEFAQIGVKTGVEGGKVAVKADTVVCKEGEPIKPAVASMITRLGIQPMEIGLNLTSVFEKGLIYGKDVLDIDETVFMNKLMTAGSEAMNLAIDIGYTTKDTIELLIQTASRHAKNLALDAGITAPEIVEELLAKGEREAMALKQEAKI